MIELLLATAASAENGGSSVARSNAELNRVVEAVVAACPGENDRIGWQIVDEGIVELQPGLLVESARMTCVVEGLKRAKVRYTFEDNRTR